MLFIRTKNKKGESNKIPPGIVHSLGVSQTDMENTLEQDVDMQFLHTSGTYTALKSQS